MLVLGIESSCDETGFALYDTTRGLVAQALHSQIALHRAYGGVVPELASRDHVRRVVPLLREVMTASGVGLDAIDAIAVTSGPGLAGALLVGTAFAHALAFELERPVIGIHHLEGHLLSPLLGANKPGFPFVALLVSGGHTQLMRVDGVGRYALLGETLDDAAGEAFDKTAKLLGLPYPGGPELSRLAREGRGDAHAFPRPLKRAGNLDFSFAGLKTAVLTAVNKLGGNEALSAGQRADIAASTVDAITDVLTSKSIAALQATGLDTLVVSGGVGANAQLRERLAIAANERGFEVFYPDLALCTDNGAMIAFAGALRLEQDPSLARPAGRFDVHPRWDLETVGLQA